MTGELHPDDRAHLLSIARGSEGLRFLAVLSDIVSDFDKAKVKADQDYQFLIGRLNGLAVGRIMAAVMESERRLESVEDTLTERESDEL